MSIIEVNDLFKEYSYYEKEEGLRGAVGSFFRREKLTKRAVDHISFDIKQGEIVGFLGPNGAGKTTTLKMLSGILHPTSGEIKIMGYVPWERRKAYKMQFAIVMGQKSQLWWDLPASESLYLNKCIYEISDKAYAMKLDELSTLFDVKHLLKIPVRRLSLGERMKFEIMASLIHTPKVIFLDEPTIGLDILSQNKIIEFFKYYNEQEKTTIILTSHYTKDIEALCHRSIIINHGKLVYDGKLDEMNKELGKRKKIHLRFSQWTDKEKLLAYGKLIEWTGFEARVQVEQKDIQKVLSKMLSDIEITDFTVEDIPLEEEIARLYQ